MDLSDKPFTPWLESVIKDMYDVMPTSIAMQMRDEDGKVYTCYYNCSQDERALFLDAMHEDGLFEWVRSNRQAILDIIHEEDDCEDEELL